jgi:parallel beta-helix repeat protein
LTPVAGGDTPSVRTITVLLASISAAFAPAQPRAVGPCDRHASPQPGALARLVSELRAGDVGCLRSGVYRETITLGKRGITIAAAPGARATVRGRLVVAADDVVLAHLYLDGRNRRRLPSPTILGNRVRLVANDITNRHSAICVNVGSVARRLSVHDVVVERNRVHDCGRVPRTNHDHGVYLERSRGARIIDNLIYDNADRGVQLYPDADDTLVARNIIDGNGTGIIISGDHGFASSGNKIVSNVIAHSGRYNVDSWWPRGNPVGRGNVVSGNCIWAGGEGDFGSRAGFVALRNTVAEPRYVDRARGDLRLRRDSPCRGKGPR